MRSPVIAMLWENWRLTRREVIQRMCLVLVLAAAILIPGGPVAQTRDRAATSALAILFVLHGTQWMSIAKLNGGRLLGAYRAGFPFHLHFARPVRTAVLVGVPMAYDAASGVALYLASALFLWAVFGAHFPLLTMVAWIAAARLMQTAAQWATRSRIVQWIASFVGVAVVMAVPVLRRQSFSFAIEFSVAEYALMAALGVSSFGVTVAGVARQRRGDVWAAWRPGASSGYPDWFVNLFRLPCPTSSAARGQVWFELKSTGLPALAIGLAGALLHPILFAVAGPVDAMRGFAIFWAALSVVTVLVLGGNAFGIRSKQGRAYATAFMATQPCGTARLAGLKVLVRTTCLLVALIGIGVSLWTSSALVNEWGVSTQRWLRLRQTIWTTISTLTTYELIALTVVTVLLLTMQVALRASLAALRARYPRPLLIVNAVVLLYGLAFVAGESSLADDALVAWALVAWVFQASSWIVASAIAVATAYLCWACLREQLLTLPHVVGAVLASAAFGAAGVTLLNAFGLQPTAMSTANTVWMLLAALLPVTLSLLAPWSLSRVRHT